MPNPVQIVLNDTDYLRAPEPGHGGPDKDFFAGRDDAFRTHRGHLAAKIATIAQTVARASFGPATYLRVRLDQEAVPSRTGPIRPC
jgi:hypothetical protein